MLYCMDDTFFLKKNSICVKQNDSLVRLMSESKQVNKLTS